MQTNTLAHAAGHTGTSCPLPVTPQRRLDLLSNLLNKQLASGILLQVLQPIMQAQFNSAADTEIGGVLLAKDVEQLEWHVHESLRTKAIRACITGYESNQNPYNTEALLGVLEHWRGNADTFEDAFEAAQLDVACLFLERYRKLGTEPLADERRLIVETARLILYHSYLASPGELAGFGPGLLGEFHVHHNNTPPSVYDLAYSRKFEMPLVVLVSDNESYRQGIDVYVISAGVTVRYAA